MEVTTQYTGFWFWLLSLRKVHLSFIHLCVRGNQQFVLFIVE